MWGAQESSRPKTSVCHLDELLVMTPARDDVGSSISTKTRSGKDSLTETSLLESAIALQALLASQVRGVLVSMQWKWKAILPRLSFSPNSHKLIPSHCTGAVNIVLISREVLCLAKTITKSREAADLRMSMVLSRSLAVHLHQSK